MRTRGSVRIYIYGLKETASGGPPGPPGGRTSPTARGAARGARTPRAGRLFYALMGICIYISLVHTTYVCVVFLLSSFHIFAEPCFLRLLA